MTTIIVCLLLLMMSLPLRADPIRTAGDYLQIAIPSLALGMTYGNKDDEGRKQMVTGLISNLAATQTIKLATDQTRPDGGRLSFPSGHTSAAFQGAAFIHRRYGLDEAIPSYIGAAFVGYSRVHARKHYWRDVIAGAALGIGISFYTSTNKNESSLSLSIDNPGILYTTRF
jgi:membrane-associated phospholipid phosphatase